MWIKAHGGGVTANVYADAAAKSHLGQEPEDVPGGLFLISRLVGAHPPRLRTQAPKTKNKNIFRPRPSEAQGTSVRLRAPKTKNKRITQRI